MKNLKTIGAVAAVLVVIILIALAVSQNWFSWLNAFIAWIQESLGFTDAGIDPFQLESDGGQG